MVFLQTPTLGLRADAGVSGDPDGTMLHIN